MSKFIASKVKKWQEDDGSVTIAFTVSADNSYAAKMCYEELKELNRPLEIDAKLYKSNRSIEQNKLLWALLGKMAMATCGKKDKVSTEDCYCAMLERANVKSVVLQGIPEAENELKRFFRVVNVVDERVSNGKKTYLYRCYEGSSKYDTKEMTDLIEMTLDRLAELGVYDSEIEVARREYK